MTGKPLAFKSSGNPRSARWGRYYYCVELADGRDVTLAAVTVDVDAGALVFRGHCHDDWPDTCECENRLLLMLSPGSWASCYAASVMYGEPVAVDAIYDATEGIKRASREPKQDAFIDTCYLCHRKLDDQVEMDHVLPVSKGGSNALVMPVHKECNQRKGNRPLL